MKLEATVLICYLHWTQFGSSFLTFNVIISITLVNSSRGRHLYYHMTGDERIDRMLMRFVIVRLP
jgi:hypothetical protein